MEKRFNVIVKVVLLLIISTYFIPERYIHPNLKKEYNEVFDIINYKCDKKQYLTPIQEIIDFSDNLQPAFVGLCSTNHLTLIRIQFSTSQWGMATETQKFHTMAHEIMHCYFGLDHIDDPNHFMYEYRTILPKALIMSQLTDILNEKCK